MYKGRVFMPWTIMGLLLIMLLILTSKGIPSGKKDAFFLKESQELEEMKSFAKENLENSNEILTIRAIRKKHGLSLVDTKKIMDIAKR